MLTPSLPDLQALNVHIAIEEDWILKEFEGAELKTPSPRKSNGDQVIYESRGLKRPKKYGRPVLCDFGEARFGKKTYTDYVQPYVYRAPEIILEIPWTYSIDIWNIGVMVSVSNANVWCFLAQHFASRFSMASIDRSGIFSRTSICSILKIATAKAQTCTNMAGMVVVPPRDYLQRTKTWWEVLLKTLATEKARFR